MKLKATLHFRFYIVSVLLLGIVALGWYGIYFLNANEIFMEDDLPMDHQTKLLFTLLMGAAVLSWTISLLAVIKQMLTGAAFVMDEEGIHATVTAIGVLAFIFVVPVRRIPYSAIERVTQEDRVLTVHIDKSKVDMLPIFRFAVSKRYHFLSGFTENKQDEIKMLLQKHCHCM